MSGLNGFVFQLNLFPTFYSKRNRRYRYKQEKKKISSSGSWSSLSAPLAVDFIFVLTPLKFLVALDKSHQNSYAV
jgi:hypothetical protein